ncbi:ABC transporter substrate-binding protein [Phytoactinopolyspora endophytica]|uniref:ABC transporter substrate-binding protein n=1 Tax=Phytoactinopolyspora endophytica TaxID=1642495 RepID=UPI003B8382DD
MAACGGDDDGETSESETESISQADIDEAMQTPTEITFWTWVPDIEKEVALFEEAYPEISVNVVNAGQGADHYAKLRTALEAGEGAPDVAQIEFQMIPTFSITENLLDLRPYGAEELADQFVDWTWAQVSGQNGEVWAIPQDTGPMGMLYREDIFEEHDIEVPETWDDFAEAARELNEADPDVFITNVAPNQGAWFSAMLWQAGANPFAGSEGERFSVDLNSEQAQQVASYWGDLVSEGVVSTDADFTDQWYQAFNQDKYATWLTAAWGPVFLASAAESTSGNWRAAPLPQWEEGEQISANWGGSTSAVMSSAQNPIVAAEFAKFLNADTESAMTMATEQFLFPPLTSVLSDPEFAEQELEFYGGQRVNEVFAEISNTVTNEFQWSPFQDQVYADFTDTVGKAFADQTDPVAALDEWQSRLTSYAENQGFTVESP